MNYFIEKINEQGLKNDDILIDSFNFSLKKKQ